MAHGDNLMLEHLMVITVEALVVWIFLHIQPTSFIQKVQSDSLVIQIKFPGLDHCKLAKTKNFSPVFMQNIIYLFEIVKKYPGLLESKEQ